MENYLVQNDPVKDSWLGIDTSADVNASNPIFGIWQDPFFKQNPHLIPVYLMKQPEFLAYAAWVLFEIRLLPFQAVCLAELWTRSFPVFVGGRGCGKTYLLALYTVMKALLCPNYKIVLVGAAFRQSRYVFEYCEKLIDESPVYRSLLNRTSRSRKNMDRLLFNINTSTITAIPIGIGGAKIRGLRANTIVADEFDSHDIEIFEKVIAGFGVVSHDPAENVVRHAKYKTMRDMGLDSDTPTKKSNQIIISGSAGYYFGPLYNYFKKTESIVKSRGDKTKLREIFNGTDPPDGFDWRDYSLIQLPYDLLPEGFLDEKIIVRAKATMNPTIFNMEYGAVFAEDSDGFFKRSVIEKAVATEKNINGGDWVSWCPSTFEPLQVGSSSKRYVYGIDPASEHDNLAIAVLEVHNEHSRIVHMWTTNKLDFKARQKRGFTKETGYNAFVARKIRELLQVFPSRHIGMDMQGGGIHLLEALNDTKHLKDGEEPLWEVVDYEKEKESDRYSGLHIVYPIQFARYEWLHEANFGLAKDMETRKLLFPRFDPVSLALASVYDKEKVVKFEKETKTKTLVFPDTLEDLFLEIEDLKDELASIVMSPAGTGVSGRLQWKVPEIQVEGNKKTRGRKDRYSALLIANSIARNIYKDNYSETDVYVAGGLVQNIDKEAKGSFYISAPEWFQAPY